MASGYIRESEAGSFTCPHIRYCVNEADVAQYQVHPIYVHQSCAGRECRMAWRESAPGYGYCGIAGHPKPSTNQWA